MSLGGQSPRRREIAPEEDFEVPALFLEGVVLLPYMEMSLSLREAVSRDVVMEALESKKLLALMPHEGFQVGEVGTLALIGEGWDPKGSISLKGLWRICVKEVIMDGARRRVKFKKGEGFGGFSADEMNLVAKVHGQVKEFMRLVPTAPREVISFVLGIDSAGKLADVCAGSSLFDSGERLKLLGTLDPLKRLALVNERLERDLKSMREVMKPASISDCGVCMDFADRALESGNAVRNGVVGAFLEHLIEKHPTELMGLVAEKYGPSFMQKRSLR